MKKLKPPITLYCDASVYNNGSRGQQEAYCAVFLDDGTAQGKELVYKAIGDKSVNEGEYEGVISALNWIAENDLDRRAIVITDSQLVYGHVVKGWHCATFTKDGRESTLPGLRDRVRYLLELTESDLLWKSRRRNLAGHFFEREVERRRREKYNTKKHKRRSKRTRVRDWTILNPKLSGYPLFERFLSKVNKTNTCWLWTGEIASEGYGQIRLGHVLYEAHKIAWFLERGHFLGEGYYLTHTCINFSCVRPSHLKAVRGKRDAKN